MRSIYKQVSVLGLGLVLGLAPHLGWAQSPIGGTVTDDKKQPLPGVSVVIKGTNRGTTTDSDGRFVLATQPGDVLVISSLGAVSQELPVGARTTLAVTLATDNKALDEVVVTALGVKKETRKIGLGSRARVMSSPLSSCTA